jgi:cell division protein FtsB
VRTQPVVTTTPARRPGGLTHRAAVLGLVVTTLVLSAALPVREYFDQRADIAELEQEQALARERIAALEEAKRQLNDPAFLAAEARRRLHMARPGEVTYVLLTPEPVPADSEATAPESDDAEPWWSQVWASVRTADEPVPPAEAPPPPAP